ncbi:hypothetical protein LXA43DRAFT_1080042 [Ganoderma leucocontextum]|nr:hypothetical protein LXA43DRAFT_1080042 [Ganoderma leucocontextum]
MKRRYVDLYSEPPANEREERMQEALRDADARDLLRKKAMAEMQGAVVLDGLYVGRVQEKMQAYDEKAGKGKGKRKLLGDGLPKLLDGDDFHGKVVEHNKQQEQEKVAKAQRRGDKEKFRELVKAWEEEGRVRSGRVAAARAEHKLKVAEYEAEVRLAKRERRQSTLQKPKLLIEPRAPKPKLREVRAHETDEEQDEETDEEPDEEPLDDEWD